MSIFRETFPNFVQEELKRRQSGMAARTPAFLQQLNTRNAWVRMTSGVNTLNASGTEYNNDLASKYILQGGVLNGDKLRSGLGGSGASTYDILSPGENPHRLGIRPMPGITNVSIQSKGAYGSLQEATVSFVAWDIKQLEDLELLYMRPGYTVLLEFGWDYAKTSNNGTLPSWPILNKPGTSINDAFAEIYTKIEESKGTYDALLGYVKNYSWVARNDGGYDCSTTIISLGEVLESLKCNWVPIETKAFSDNGIFNLNLPTFRSAIKNSYELGIIPGLLHEMWGYLRSDTYQKESKENFSAELTDPTNGTKYQLCMSETMQGPAKFNRGGLPKPLGNVSQGTEAWITLGSFCDLLNNYVLLKDEKDNPLVQITTNETDAKGNISNTSLKCIASPLSLSTNLGVCLIRNDNWVKLGIKQNKSEETEDKNSTTSPPEKSTPSDILTAIDNESFSNINRFKNKTIINSDGSEARYNGVLEDDIAKFASDLQLSIIDVIVKNNQIRIILPGNTGNNNFIFNTSNSKNLTTLNWFDYFYPSNILVLPSFPGIASSPITLNIGENTLNQRVNAAYEDLFFNIFTISDIGVPDRANILYDKAKIINLLKKYLSTASISTKIQDLIQSTTFEIAQNVSEEAKGTLITKNTLQFLVPETSLKKKVLGNISNIYVNINYLYSQAVSKNVASTDNQNTNNISIREYLQGILRDIQNSLGNINQFDIQVDERTAIGRIVDLNFTGNPDQELFELQIHNTNSVVRDYGFQSKIFPEMGSIIAISAQDPSGIGKLGYDNATLVAWNDGVRDRLIPKKTFNSKILISGEINLNAFILPFLTKIYDYFEAIKGEDKNNVNFLFGGLDFAYRDFLANVNKFDPRNNFKTIIPTTLDITLDGIGGMVIGNLFTINQDIIPKGYRSAPGRKLAYIVTKLGHNISNNDWTTELSAYPIIFEQATGADIASEWDNQQYLGDSTEITIDGISIARVPTNNTLSATDTVKKVYIPARNIAIPNRSEGLKILLTGHVTIEGFKDGTIAFDLNNPGNFRGQVGNIKPVALNQRVQASTGKGFARFATLQDGILTQAAQVDRILAGKSTAGYTPEDTLLQYLSRYSTVEEGPAYTQNMIAFFRTYGVEITADTKLKDIVAITKLPNGKTVVDIEAGNTPGKPVTEADKKATEVKIIAQRIKNAASGPGTNESKLISSIKQIKNVNTFREVNKIVNIQDILNDELGLGDTNNAQTLKNYLNTIGVNLQFETGAFGVTSVKITYK